MSNSELIQQLLDTPPSEWATLIDPLPISDRQRLENEADNLAAAAAFLSGYLLPRGTAGAGDHGHESGLTAGRKCQKAVRKALGYHSTNP